MGRPWGDHSNRSTFYSHARGSLFPIIIECLKCVKGVGLKKKNSPFPWGASPSPWGGHGEAMGRPWGGHSNRSPLASHPQGSLLALIIDCFKRVDVVGLICKTSPSPWGASPWGGFQFLTPHNQKWSDCQSLDGSRASCMQVLKRTIHIFWVTPAILKSRRQGVKKSLKSFFYRKSATPCFFWKNSKIALPVYYKSGDCSIQSPQQRTFNLWLAILSLC